MKDMFYYGGLPNGGDGRCAECFNWIMENAGEGARCAETNQDIKNYVIHGHINRNCPFIQKER